MGAPFRKAYFAAYYARYREQKIEAAKRRYREKKEQIEAQRRARGGAYKRSNFAAMKLARSYDITMDAARIMLRKRGLNPDGTPIVAPSPTQSGNAYGRRSRA